MGKDVILLRWEASSPRAGGLSGLPWAVYQESEKKLIKVSRATSVITPVLSTCTEQLFTV